MTIAGERGEQRREREKGEERTLGTEIRRGNAGAGRLAGSRVH